MATILEFKSAQRPNAASMLSACAASESAEIVFFPGVRYERHSDETSSDRAKAQRHSEDVDLES